MIALLIPPFTGIPSCVPVSAIALHIAHWASALTEKMSVNTAMKMMMRWMCFTGQNYGFSLGGSAKFLEESGELRSFFEFKPHNPGSQLRSLLAAPVVSLSNHGYIPQRQRVNSSLIIWRNHPIKHRPRHTHIKPDRPGNSAEFFVTWEF